ncbi:MAG: dimethylsulfone monooxygenase [Chloroflexota bacterium]|jgi:alkanesulfonate monooxygenase SsuD/methylene tetrahydromethanopterin reductase-like flavin-dependent oxidoreductase (luciferase family)|nr:dimethylsulfone monooxygenase [Chloroflexota bacterium]
MLGSACCEPEGRGYQLAERNAILTSGNRLKLGLFGANCSSGRTYITAPERWDTSWEHNVQLAQLADEAGIECMVPIARWKGYGGASNPNGTSWESITWACGLLAATRRINVFATVHVPLNHPLVAAKQLATADHIGRGRFGVNVVCGWNEDEFRMFGVTKQEHDDRYAQGAEWWTIVQRIWAGEDPFDFTGQHYQLAGVEGSPSPYGGAAPLMMNAGSSPAGRAFAIRYSDMHFDGVKSPEESIERIAETKRLAAAAGREIQVWTPIGVVCRPTRQEAAEFVDYLVDNADLGAMGHLAEMHRADAKDRTDAEGRWRGSGEGPLERRVLARGSYCAVGDPDWVVQELARLHGVGFDGLVINFADYLAELPYFVQEVLPRLARLGLRAT